MSFKRLDPEDFLVSVDSITATAWSTNSPTLSTFYTASDDSQYYLNVYQTASTDADAAIQFGIAYGNSAGSGSENYNDLVPGYSPTRTVYGQFRNLVYGDENAAFIFETVTASDFWAISVEIARYKEQDTWRKDPYFPKEGFELLQNVLSEAGELENRVNYEELVDTSFCEEIEKE